MNKEQFRALIAALEVIAPPCRRDAIERALRITDGGASIDDMFGATWDDLFGATWDDPNRETWNAPR